MRGGSQSSSPSSTSQERAHAKDLMELPDGRPSALAASIAAAGDSATAEGSEPAVKTFDVGKGAAGRLMTPQERKAIEEAIERSSSLEEIRRLEERLKMGYTTAA